MAPIDDWTPRPAHELAAEFVQFSRPYYLKVRPVISGIEYFGVVRVDPVRRHAALGPLRTRTGAEAILDHEQREAIVREALR
jgi:hypothetical protein